MTADDNGAQQSPVVPIVVLSLMVVACLLSGVMLTGLSVDHYSLPAPDGGVQSMTHTYTERVALAWTAWAGAAGAAIGLVLTLLKRPLSRVWWVVLAILTMVALNAALIISAQPTPSY